MAYTYDEDGSMSQSILDRQRRKAQEGMRKQREERFKQESIKYFNRENKLRKPTK